MHGRQRAAVAAVSPEKLREQRSQVQAGFSLLQQLLKYREEKVYTPQLLETTKKILKLSPELGTVWGYRREALLHLLRVHRSDSALSVPPSSEEAGCDAGALASRESESLALLLTELQFTTAALKEGSTKIYCLWHHRSWVLAQLISFHLSRHLSPSSQPLSGEEADTGGFDLKTTSGEATSTVSGLAAACSLVEDELQCCVQMLEKVDGRNFHCWQHLMINRVWLSALRRMQMQSARQSETTSSVQTVGAADLLLEKESVEWIMELTQRLISLDFSNYSAWHFRGLALRKTDVVKDLQWLWQGLYTDPCDQSLWRQYLTLLFYRPKRRRLVAAFLQVQRETNPKGGSRNCQLLLCFRSPVAVSSTNATVQTLLPASELHLELSGTWRSVNAPLAGLAGGFNANIQRQFLQTFPEFKASPVWIFSGELPEAAVQTLFKSEEAQVVLQLHLPLQGASAASVYAETSSFPTPPQNAEAAASARSADAFWTRLLTDLAPKLKLLSKEVALDLPSPPCSFASKDSQEFLCVQFKVEPRNNGTNNMTQEFPLRLQKEEVLANNCQCGRERNTSRELQIHSDESDAEAAVALEAAGGSLSEELSASVAAAEFQSLEELLQVEPSCSSALEAQFRLLLALAPSDFELQRKSLTRLLELATNRRPYEDMLGAVNARAEVQRQLRSPSSGDGKESVSTEGILDLSSLGLRRLAYPVLLQGAASISSLCLDSNPLLNCALIDWHVGFLPNLRRLSLRNTTLTDLTSLLLSAKLRESQRLLDLFRIDASGSQLQHPLKSCGFQRTSGARRALLDKLLKQSSLREVDLSDTPAAADFAEGEYVGHLMCDKSEAGSGRKKTSEGEAGLAYDGSDGLFCVLTRV